MPRVSLTDEITEDNRKTVFVYDLEPRDEEVTGRERMMRRMLGGVVRVAAPRAANTSSASETSTPTGRDHLMHRMFGARGAR